MHGMLRRTRLRPVALLRTQGRRQFSASSSSSSLSSSAAAAGNQQQQGTAREGAALPWLVVGGGPMGIGAVGVLAGAAERHPVLWTDACGFGVGRLALYRDVPANTQAKLLQWALHSCSAVFGYPHVHGAKEMHDLAPEGCHDLGWLTQALRGVTHHMLSEEGKQNGITGMPGVVRELRYREAEDVWEATVYTEPSMLRELEEHQQRDPDMEDNEQIDVHTMCRRLSAGAEQDGDTGEETVHRVQGVVLATGSHPAPPPVQETKRVVEEWFALDEMVSPSRVHTLLCSDEDLRSGTWTVVGGSHSAMLIVKNLIDADVQSIRNIYRKDLIFAEERDGWTKFDGTGLKGDVKDWCLETLPDRRIVRIEYDPDRTWEENVSIPPEEQDEFAIGHFGVFATGFVPNTLPRIIWHKKNGTEQPLTIDDYNPSTSQIADGIRLYGAGIAFPELWCDPDGLYEHRVGFRGNIMALRDRIHEVSHPEDK